MKIGFITTPLTTSHAGRGIGFYTRYLLEHLKPLAERSGHQLIEITDPSHTPPVDLLHYPYFDLFFHTLPLFHPVPVVVTVHDVIPLEFPLHYPPGLKGTGNLWLQRLALSGVSMVITDSYASVKAIRRYLRVPHEKIKLVYLAPAPHFRPVKDKKLLRSVAARYKLPDRFILYVGDVNWNKNLPGLMVAALQLDVPLVLVGKRTALLDDLDLSHAELAHLKPVLELIHKTGTKVIRLGFVPDSDLVSVYNLATVYCQPSFAEGFGLPVLEAMACGTPVVCSRTHSLPEIAGEAAQYFDPDNIESLVWALGRVLKDQPVRSGLSKAGLLQVKKYSWEYAAAGTLAVYGEVLSK